jgi:hypothetical protein
MKARTEVLIGLLVIADRRLEIVTDTRWDGYTMGWKTKMREEREEKRAV